MAQNTTQGLIGAKYAGNFIMQANAPLDDRTVVASKDKLLQYDGYVYPGMLVASLDTNDLYLLISVANKDSYSGWKKISGGSIDPSILDQKADITYVDEQINLVKGSQVNYYEETVTDSSATSKTILNSTHKCGKFPSITVYCGLTVAYSQAEVNASGDVTIEWSATPSQETPIRIILIGKDTTTTTTTTTEETQEEPTTNP